MPDEKLPDGPMTVGNDALEIVRRNALERSGLVLHDRLVLDARARLTAAFIERWGMVMANVDGEDSAGRQKLSLMKPDDIVDRAVETVERAFEAFAGKGWLIESPPYSEWMKDAEKSNR